MKKIVIALLAAALLLSACGKEVEEEQKMEEKTPIEQADFASGIQTEEDSKAVEETTAAQPTPEAQQTPEVKPLEPGVEVTCPAAAYTRRAGVTYPKAVHVTYHSETCGCDRGVNILVPADYSSDKKYPVFYVLHGIFGNENSFSSDSGNKIVEIVTNMAADGRIEAPIIVYPNMYAASDPSMQPGFTAEACEPYDNFVNDLVNDLMPYMAENYSIYGDRENTWLAGFSMGGRETLYITLCHPELFGYVCAISPAPGMTPAKDMFMEHPGTITEDEVRFAEDAILPETFMVCCGTRDSVVGTFPKEYHELMEKNGIDHIWFEVTGADHDNNAIRSGIYNLMKEIALH